MTTFRTKTREVEAFRWNGQPVSEFPPWAQDPRFLAPSGTALYAYTKNGPVRINRGDWIIQEKLGVTPCTDEEFQKRYEITEMSALELGAALREAGEASYED